MWQDGGGPPKEGASDPWYRLPMGIRLHVVRGSRVDDNAARADGRPARADGRPVDWRLGSRTASFSLAAQLLGSGRMRRLGRWDAALFSPRRACGTHAWPRLDPSTLHFALREVGE